MGLDRCRCVAVSINGGILSKGFRAPLQGFGVDTGQV